MFNHSNYRDLISEIIDKNKKRGFKTRIAEAAGCQLSYFSQVIKGSVHLTEDQAFGIAEYLSFNEIETEYLILLVRIERAGSLKLKSFLKNRLSIIRKHQNNLSDRIGKKEIIFEYKEEYYSAWYYSAIHIALSIPALQEKSCLAKALNLDMKTFNKAISFLCKMGLIKGDGKYYKTVEYNLHVPSNSPLFTTYNVAWRNYFGQRIQNKNIDEIHYTAVHSLSESDFEKLRQMIFQFIENSRKIVAASKEEALAFISIDFCGP